MLILFGMPIVLMFLFGFAISTDVKNVRTVVVTANSDHSTRLVVERLAQSEYFVITHTVATPREAEWLIRSQKADMAVVFASKRKGVQFIVDGSDPNMAQQWTAYAQQTISPPNPSRADMLNTKLLYNPQMRSAYNFVPAIMGMLLMLICAMMTSISIVRDINKHSAREGERYYGGAACIACTAADGHRCHGCALSGIGFRHPRHHPSHGTFRVECAVDWLLSLYTGCIHAIYPVSPLIGITYL